MVRDVDGFATAILAAPVGAALLARLEAWAIGDSVYARLGASSPRGVAAAVSLVEELSIGELIDAAVYVGEIDVGPWISDAPTNAANAYENAGSRTPIAHAIAERFGATLQRPPEAIEQQWWTTHDGMSDHELTPLFNDFERVYDAGQFTWAGLWTVTNPPEFAHAQLIDAWEMEPGPVARWRLPIRPEARVFEIHRPQDWVRLVTEHPRRAATNGECWELPSRNQDLSGIASLLEVPGQQAARGTMRTHLVPDWKSVAEQYDGVHLSWAGFITSEGYITDLAGGDVAMLRYWFSERTHWLADVFGDPEPLAAPSPPPDRHGESYGPSSEPESSRPQRDRAILDKLLGRTVATEPTDTRNPDGGDGHRRRLRRAPRVRQSSRSLPRPWPARSRRR